MANKTRVILIDDLDGTEATETVEFGVDGATFAIDLNDANAEALRDALSPWTQVARKKKVSNGLHPVTRHRATKKATASSDQLTRNDRDHLRVWAAIAGYLVAERGRIPQEVQQAWTQAGRPAS